MDVTYARAVIFFGFIIDPEKGMDRPFDLAHWEDAFAARAGVTDPVLRKRLIDNAPGQVIPVGSAATPRYALAYRKAMWGASGISTPIPTGFLEILDHDVTRFRAFAKMNGIRWPESVGWLLSVIEPDAPRAQVPVPLTGPPFEAPGQEVDDPVPPEPDLPPAAPLSSSGGFDKSFMPGPAESQPSEGHPMTGMMAKDPKTILIDPNDDYADVP